MAPCPPPDSPAWRVMEWRVMGLSAMAVHQRASEREEPVWLPLVEAERRPFQSAAWLQCQAAWPRCRAV
jgi:hypothetical protein